jgi:hypothetical protein
MQMNGQIDREEEEENTGNVHRPGLNCPAAAEMCSSDCEPI